MVHGPAHAGVYMVLVGSGAHHVTILVQHLEVASSFGEGRLHSDTEGAVVIWLPPILVVWEGTLFSIVVKLKFHLGHLGKYCEEAHLGCWS